MFKYSLGFFFALMAFTACERPSPPATAGADASYNLSSYLQQQKERMALEQPMVLKSVSTEGKPAETVETDEIDWEDELAVFEQLDLRRPALEEYYIKQESVLENGDIAILYKKREDSEPLVHYLNLTLTPERKLKQLEAVLQDKNPLFYSHRFLQLQTQPGSGNISSYSIKGVQKLIFSDSLRFSLDANL